ncbi:hypothetical protein ACQ86G_08705 [Roseateles chitinivorans]|uniref:hypothetical protein n=1 Tax=Roseateles chitinivorans TaxID=2917965 RepID=UPI003D67BD30
MLGFLSAAIGAEAFWAMAAVAPEPLIGSALQVIAVAWTACCALLIRHRWRQPGTVDRGD